MKQYFAEMRPLAKATTTALNALLDQICRIEDASRRETVLAAWRALARAVDDEHGASEGAAATAVERATLATIRGQRPAVAP